MHQFYFLKCIQEFRFDSISLRPQYGRHKICSHVKKRVVRCHFQLPTIIRKFSKVFENKHIINVMYAIAVIEHYLAGKFATKHPYEW